MSDPLRVIYSAAHAEFADSEPLGGGKAVADFLIREWTNVSRFDLDIVSPRSTGLLATLPDQSLAHLGEWGYARFCREFERASTQHILSQPPTHHVVLVNDISEGPDFAACATRGHRLVTIFHVDVVEYFTRFYLRNLVRPEMLTRVRNWAWAPDVLRLVFQKQRDCVEHSAAIVVPSAPMKEMIRRCYPEFSAGKIVVMPWGNIADVIGGGSGEAGRGEQGSALHPGDDEFVIVTLSRLSPEKGIERLLQALPLVRAGAGQVRVAICGGAAYMNGRRYERQLRRLARRINNVRVEFRGHVTGSDKARILQRADLFVSPSIHESYGLAIEQARAAGCRILSHAHYGGSGEIVDCGDPMALSRAIERNVSNGRTKKPDRPAATSDVATRLADLLYCVAETGLGIGNAASTTRQIS